MNPQATPAARRLIARLRLASPDDVLRWSSGAVSKATRKGARARGANMATAGATWPGT
jgi:hypothetical protein